MKFLYLLLFYGQLVLSAVNIMHMEVKNIVKYSPIAQLIGLKDKIEADINLKDFPLVASRILSELRFEFSIEELEQDLAMWFLDLNKLPKQVNLYNDFGEPSVSLFNNDKYSIDLYFWRKNDTLIHSHGFRGAFKVLYGKSLHEEFQVETNYETNSKSKRDVVKSKISKSKIEILNKGDTRTILPGMDLVHRILHLDNPTVSLCIRTVNDAKLSQWHHLSTGISYKQINISDLLIKRILYFQYLYRTNKDLVLKYLNESLNSLSDSSQLSLYMMQFQNKLGLDEDFLEFLINHMQDRLYKKEWFNFFENHYNKLEKNLYEFHASKASLKFLAHAVNSNYSKKEVIHLLEKFSDENLNDLCKQLLNEGHIFNEEFFSEQQIKIKQYLI